MIPVELAVLDLGSVRGPGVPIPAYLVTFSDGSLLLVDTGCPREMVDDPEAVFAVDAEHHVSGALARLGRSCADVGTVVLSHLDPDHCGGVAEFPHAQMVVQRAQYEHATSSGLHRYEWMRPHWDRPELRYRLVDGDVDLLPGVRLVECGGHVPGHQAVVVTLPETGAILLAGDAWMRGTDAGTRPMTPFDHDEAGTRRSQAALQRLASEIPARLVIHNHDVEQWADLRRAPECYR